MAAQQRPLSPHLDIYRWGITMSLSILHRATGVFIAFGAFLMALWLVAVASGDDEYRRFVELAGSVPGRLLMVAILASFLYHLLNGIRHLLWDIGWGLEMPRVVSTGATVVVLTLLGTAWIAWLAFAGAAP
jgi:succinate dehydrogenase / fumarate reductase cytochrome b subunit